MESAGTPAGPGTVKDADERLLDVFGSGVVETTAPVLTTDPGALGATTTS
jgi:hypothetical protein